MEREALEQWVPWEGGEVRLSIPDRYLPEVERYGLPDDLHPDLYPEMFEFREVQDAGA